MECRLDRELVVSQTRRRGITESDGTPVHHVDRGVALPRTVPHRVLNDQSSLDDNKGLCPTLLGRKALPYVVRCCLGDLCGVDQGRLPHRRPDPVLRRGSSGRTVPPRLTQGSGHGRAVRVVAQGFDRQVIP